MEERGVMRLRLNKVEREESEDEDKATNSGNLLTLIRKELLRIFTGSCPINMSKPIRSLKEESTPINLSDGDGNEDGRVVRDEDNARRFDIVTLFEPKDKVRMSRELINGRADS